MMPALKSRNAEYVLPEPWVEIVKRDGFGNDESMHFCSKNCLVEWATKGEVALEGHSQEALGHVDECLDSLHTGIMVGLHPQEAANGPAGIMSQMMVVENVKEDFKKLEEAIKALRKEHYGKED